MCKLETDLSVMLLTRDEEQLITGDSQNLTLHTVLGVFSVIALEGRVAA